MIKNKLQIGFLVMIFSLFVGFSSAHAAAITFTEDTNVTIGVDNYVIANGSEATSLVNSGTTLTVVVPSSSVFHFSSPDGYTLTNDSNLTPVCSDVDSSLVITGPLTVVITPSTTVACVQSNSGGSHHSGGGGSSSTLATPAVPANTTPPADCLPGFMFSPSTGRNCNAATPAVPATPANPGSNPMHGPYNFGLTVLKNGSRGEGVKELQRFLNWNLNLGLVVDGMLGPKTIAVIKTWQKNHGLVADGLIGPKTKAMMNSMAY